MLLHRKLCRAPPATSSKMRTRLPPRPRIASLSTATATESAAAKVAASMEASTGRCTTKTATGGYMAAGLCVPAEARCAPREIVPVIAPPECGSSIDKPATVEVSRRVEAIAERTPEQAITGQPCVLVEPWVPPQIG